MSETFYSGVLPASTLTEFLPVVHRMAFYASIAGFFYAISYIVYQYQYHPLSKYPGPFLAKFTNAYSAYHAAKGDMHIDMWRCHQKYGKFVRYAPDRLLIDSAEGLRDIYSHHKNVTKSQVYNTMVHKAPNTLTMLDNKEHARRRRVMSSGFSNTALRSYEPKVLVHAKKLCSLIPQETDGEWSEPQNMTKWSHWFAFDIMADLVFGMKYDLLGNPKFRYVIDCIAKSNQRVSTVGHMQSLGFCRLDKRLFPVAIAARNRFLKFVGRCLFERLKMGSQKDIFSLLTDAKDPQDGSGFTPMEIAAESTTLIVAGSDTSATLLSTFFFYLSRTPDVYAKAAQEVRATFSSVDDISNVGGLNKCSYLRACLDETARISPPVGGAMWREVLSGGALIDGEHIPEQCDVGTGVYSIHHHPKYFPEPFKYRPERWIVGEGCSTLEEVKLAQSAYTPFSFGPRGCVGKQLALTDLMIAMATILYEYDFKVADGPYRTIGEGNPNDEFGRHRAQEFQIRDHISGQANGPYIQFRRREFSAPL